MLDEAALEQIGRRLGLAGSDLSEVLDPRAIVQTRSAPGGAAPEVVTRMAAGCAAAARALGERAAALHAGQTRAEAELLRRAAEVVGSAPS
jgi:argininosuccinate lyase